jgi:hypothetical protein
MIMRPCFAGRGALSEGRSRTIRAGLGMVARLLLVGSVWIATVAPSDAAPYYTVTPLGDDPFFSRDSGLVTQSVTNTQTGVSYPFVTTTTPITAADLRASPGEPSCKVPRTPCRSNGSCA